MQFLNLPYEIKAKVFSLSASGDPCSSLVTLSRLSRTCRHFQILVRGTPEHPTYSVPGDVCRECFDLAAPLRRLGTLTDEQRAAELKRRCCVFKRIATGSVYGDMVVHDLWVAYLMLLEDDGHNSAQLEHVRLEAWVRNIITLRGREEVDIHGWPLETELLQLAVAILARVSTRVSVAKETEKERNDLLAQIQPFFLAGHRYPVALLPTTQYYISNTSPLPPAHTHTFHTMASAPIYQAEELPFPHFGRRITLSRPPLALSCILVWYLRTQHVLGHQPNIPANRRIAEDADYHNATVADYDEANLVQQLGLGVEVPWATKENRGSRRWDSEWYRLAFAHVLLHPNPDIDLRLSLCWYRTVYEPGMFRGNWVGRAMNPSFRWYTSLLNMHPAPLERVAELLPEDDIFHAIMPMQLNLRDHFSSTVDGVVSSGHIADGHGVQNGWFPDELDISHPRGGMRLVADELIIDDPWEPDVRHATKRYKTWHPDVEFPEARPPPMFPLASAPRPSSRHHLGTFDTSSSFVPSSTPEDVEMIFTEEFGTSRNDTEDEDSTMDDGQDIPPFVDIILTGETDYIHGEAWGHCKTYGRVRHNDGLFLLVRVPENGAFGRWIFRGYMYGNHALVGRWRETGTSLDVAGWEGVFVLARVPDSWPH